MMKSWIKKTQGGGKLQYINDVRSVHYNNIIAAFPWPHTFHDYTVWALKADNNVQVLFTTINSVYPHIMVSR